MERDQITKEQVSNAIFAIESKLWERFREKGMGAAVSVHEAYAVIHEELAEAEDEMRANDKEKFKKEAIDIAVAALWAVASL